MFDAYCFSFVYCVFFFFKQKTSYDMRISDWSSDVCSSDLGIVENLLLVLEKGGRLAARRDTRANEIITLDHAAYSPCAVEDSEGCPKEPTWQIRAVRVVYNPYTKRVTYKGARVELFGLPLIPLPGLSHPVGGEGGSGLLVPDIRYDRVNGHELSMPDRASCRERVCKYV